MTATLHPKEVVTDLADPVMFADPGPRFAELRRSAPVSTVHSKQLIRGGTGCMVTRYADVMQVHTDPRLSSDILRYTKGSWVVRLLPRSMRLLLDSMVFKDDPDHKRLRNLVNKAFTPKRVQAMNDHIEQVVAELIDDLAKQDGTVDLISSSRPSCRCG